MHYAVTVKLPVQWGDMDALGHVNNVCYFRWFESARIAYFQRIGLGTHGREGVGPILAQSSCDFLVPLYFPAEIEVGARVARVGHTSLTMEYGLWRVDAPEAPHARGGGVVVIVDLATGVKTRVPDELRRAIAALEGEG